MDNMPGKNGLCASGDETALCTVMADPYVRASVKMNSSSTGAC